MNALLRGAFYTGCLFIPIAALIGLAFGPHRPRRKRKGPPP